MPTPLAECDDTMSCPLASYGPMMGKPSTAHPMTGDGAEVF